MLPLSPLVFTRRLSLSLPLSLLSHRPSPPSARGFSSTLPQHRERMGETRRPAWASRTACVVLLVATTVAQGKASLILEFGRKELELVVVVRVDALLRVRFFFLFLVSSFVSFCVFIVSLAIRMRFLFGDAPFQGLSFHLPALM